MLLPPDKKHINDLTALWQRSFGDEIGYIQLFFEHEYVHCRTFACFCEGKIVSALYLLPIKLNFCGESFSGYYLYAAATAPGFRKGGLMARLIEEAKAFCAENGAAFISLVPGTASLYEYYRKFGFVCAMYRIETKLNFLHAGGGADLQRVGAAQYREARCAFLQNSFAWDEQELEYVFSCFNYYDIHAFAGRDHCFIAEKNGTVHELLFEESAFERAISAVVCRTGSENLTVLSKEKISEKSERVPFGMIFPIDPKLKREWNFTDIYMNLALD